MLFRVTVLFYFLKILSGSRNNRSHKFVNFTSLCVIQIPAKIDNVLSIQLALKLSAMKQDVFVLSVLVKE